MRSVIPRGCVRVLVGLGLTILTAAVGAGTAPTPEEWREDLHFLMDRLSQLHPNVYYSTDQKSFEAAVRRLDERLPSMSGDEIVVGLAGITALVGDGHTNFYLPLTPLEAKNPRSWPPEASGREPFTSYLRLPIVLHVFSDGLFVRAAAPECREAVGARVVKIGGTPVEAAMEKVKPLLDVDRVAKRGNISKEKADAPDDGSKPNYNESSVKALSAYFLGIPVVLKVLGLSDSTERATFTLEDSSGKRWDQEIHATPTRPEIAWVSANADAAAPKPLYLKDPGNLYWFEPLEQANALYVQLNAIQNKPKDNYFLFSNRLFEYIDGHRGVRLILDLRMNGGGDNTLNRAIVTKIIERKELNQSDRLYVIIGRQTFSAASNLAIDLNRMTRATFVGEPNGNCINFYGDAKYFQLPHSGLRGRCSTLFWQNGRPTDLRRGIEPDIPAPLSSADFRANRDPALEAILQRPPAKQGN